ncbi:hypothetical protein G5I_01882 [Acromyrmex echinatior]|uniref:Insertion element IS150 protein InsJ-like helix-turn-helix domain-containing protein n=1 Tax=Acromyrmex echinatior TaxID=103372 RepID=F4W8U5_ACREC|nr:hypothetical protein G5I_01882 [Acromyrmex echinatior]
MTSMICLFRPPLTAEAICRRNGESKLIIQMMLKPSAEYNRRAAIIKDLRAGRSATEIIRFFGYPRSTVYDVVAKYTALEQFNEGSSMPARKSHSKERTARIPVVERAQTLISDDPRQSLRKLASIVGVSEPTMRRIAEEDLRYKSYTLKKLSEAATTRNCSICPDFGDPNLEIITFSCLHASGYTPDAESRKAEKACFGFSALA